VIVLDTTVLVYAVGHDHPLRDPCRALVSSIAGGRLEATTTAEVIQEFVHVRARRRPRRDAANLGRSYVDLLSPLLAVTETHVIDGLGLFERRPALGAFDAVLAAAAIDLGAQALVSADQTFAAVPGLHHVTPGSAGFDALIGRESQGP
jgi:predicted nucleic acid-binding protein